MSLAKFLTASEGSGLRPMVTGIIHRYVLLLQIETAVVRKRSALSSQPGRKSMCTFMHGTLCAVSQQGALQIHIHSMVLLWLDCHSAFLSGVVRISPSAQLAKLIVLNPKDEDVMKYITKKELSLHVRRKTPGIPVITMLISNLLEAFSGQGNDTLGVPLLDCDRIWTIWHGSHSRSTLHAFKIQRVSSCTLNCHHSKGWYRASILLLHQSLNIIGVLSQPS